MHKPRDEGLDVGCWTALWTASSGFVTCVKLDFKHHLERQQGNRWEIVKMQMKYESRNLSLIPPSAIKKLLIYVKLYIL